MLRVRSTQLLRSSLFSKFSTQNNQLITTTNFTCHKPFSTTFLRHLTSTTDGSQQEDYSRVTSVDEIAKGVVHLQCESSAEGGVCDVYLVGTIHVSQKSCMEVKAVINYLKPQAVFLELCQARTKVLTNQNFKVPTMSEIFDMWKNKKAHPLGIILSWCTVVAASELGVQPGAEFRVAYEEARRYGGSVYIGDRPFHITLRRAWNGITKWSMMKCLYHITFKSYLLGEPDTKMMKLKEVTDADPLKYMLQMTLQEFENGDVYAAHMQEMHKVFPSLFETLVVERDKYMSRTLWNVARKHSSVVAVVGKGHLSGIKKYWMQPVELKSLLEVPSKKVYFSVSKMFASVRDIKDVVAGIYHRSKK